MNLISNLEESIGIKGHLLNFKGIQGIIKRIPEDFIVREILPDGTVISNGSEIGSDVGGMYTHFVLWKRGIDTYSALKKIAKVCHLEERDFSFAGLKDAQAVSLQRISVWGKQKNCLEKIDIPNLRIINPIRQKFSIPIGSLAGNQFQVKIQDISEKIENVQWLKFRREALDRGFLNFFGLQRFGSKRPILHLVGQYLLQEKYSCAIDSYLGGKSIFEHEKISSIRERYRNGDNPSDLLNEFPRSYSFERSMMKGLIKRKSPERIILSLSQYFLRLAISSYQSYLFNIILQDLHKSEYPQLHEVEIPLVGYATDLSVLNEEIRFIIKDQLTKDNLNLNSFKHKHKLLRTKGFHRTAIVKPTVLKLMSSGSEKNTLQILFNLTKGSYATMFLREVLR
ncbi:MAG: tRNA pseudouridine(13) synthase TruD [Candidatus Hodarchaeales archaeon]